jgi:hypothetical protein
VCLWNAGFCLFILVLDGYVFAANFQLIIIVSKYFFTELRGKKFLIFFFLSQGFA